MTPVTHQTIRLSRGNHLSPNHGACVMELASMLAGEEFSDHPRAVCPVLGGLLRTYNDVIDDNRRQDLYRYAAEVVGTRSTPEVEHQRALRASAWARDHRQPSRLNIFGWSWLHNLVADRVDDISAGVAAVRTIRRHDDRTHAAMLGLIDELIAIGRPAEGSAAPATAALDVPPCASDHPPAVPQVLAEAAPRGAVSPSAHRRN